MRTSLPKNQEIGPSAGQKRQYPVRKPRLRPIRAITSPYRRTKVVDQTFLREAIESPLIVIADAASGIKENTMAANIWMVAFRNLHATRTAPNVGACSPVTNWQERLTYSKLAQTWM